MAADDTALAERRRAARNGVRRGLSGHALQTPREVLARLAAADPGESLDRYGQDGVVGDLEAEVAELLGKPAAVFMPSGIMAQQCALRVWSDRVGSPRIALHGLSHLIVHELDALPSLHHLQPEHLTDEPRQPTPRDLAALPGRLGAATLELPLRDAAYRLPTWDELVAFAEACRTRGVPLHLDGARLWESQPYLAHSHAEIAALADSVYVSFYKGLAGIAGAALAGPEDMIAEARRWQRRHGGNLFSLLPYAVLAREGLHTHLPRMGEYHDAAAGLATQLSAAGMRVVPDPPHTNAFCVYVEGDEAAVNERLLQHAEQEREAVMSYLSAAVTPGWLWAEFSVGAATIEAGIDTVAKTMARLLLADE
ncbi:MAG: threonine aldolase family protein [Nocardioidaceae bacterium]